jgi:pheromone shutdown protein TraB
MQNKITIIGTVHNATKNYSVDDLYNKLCDIKPDIILFEWPLEWEKHLEAQMVYAAKTGLVEAIAFLKYSSEHDVEIKLYDIPGRNDFYMKTRCFEIEKEVAKAYDAYFKSEHPNHIAITYKRLLSRVGRMQRELDKGTLEEINSSACDLLLKINLEIIDSAYSAILDLVPELKRFKPALLRQDRYEVKRNKTMVKNILNYNKQYENKHLVVLCGYYHRYALVSMLKSKQKTDAFTLNY